MSNKDFQNGFIAGWASRPGNAQSDLNENDPTSISYVKNRTHYKEEVVTKVDETTVLNVEPIPGLGFAPLGKKVGLEIGVEYTFDVYMVDGSVQTHQFTAFEMDSQNVGGLTGVAAIETSVSVFVDGIDINPSTGEMYYADNAYYVIKNQYIEKIVLREYTRTDVVYHKIPGEYITTPDWDEGDENNAAHIKNRTHYDGVAFVKDFVLPETVEFEQVVEDTGVVRSGYAFVGQKLNFVAGRTYVYDLLLTDVDSGNTATEQFVLTSYPANQVIPELGEDWADVIVLLNEAGDLMFSSGGFAADLTDLSTFKKVDDTIYFAYIPTVDGLSIVSTLQNYNAKAHTLKTLDSKYLPNGAITTEKLVDKSVTTQKLGDFVITGNKFEKPKKLFYILFNEPVLLVRQDLGAYYKKIRVQGFVELDTTDPSITLTIDVHSTYEQVTFDDVPESGEKRLNFTMTLETTDVSKETEVQGVAIEICYTWNDATQGNVKKVYAEDYSITRFWLEASGSVPFKSGGMNIYSLLSFEE